MTKNESRLCRGANLMPDNSEDYADYTEVDFDGTPYFIR